MARLWLGVFVARTIEAEPRAEISGLVAGAGFRSQEIGALLRRRAEEWALGKGCAAIGARSGTDTHA